MTHDPTFFSVLKGAFNQTLYRRVVELDSKLHSQQQFLDLSAVQLQEPDLHLLKTTLPSILGLSFLIGFVMYLSNINSFICNICTEKFGQVDKTIIPLADQLEV